MMAIVFTNWPGPRSGCHADQLEPYELTQDVETAPSALSTAKPLPPGEKLETADVDPFVQM